MNSRTRPTIRLRSARLAAGAAVAVVACAALAPAAVAAPGSPGTPAAPVTVFNEGFGTGLTLGELISLEDYGTQNYTAHADWLSAAAGNGLIIDGTTSNADFLAGGYNDGTGAAYDFLREMATKLGQLNGSSPANSNHAVTAYTAANPGANLVEFRTETPLPLNAGGRFLTISANVGVANCQAQHPQLAFYLDDGGTETAVNTTALDPCPDNVGGVVHATHLQGGRAVLFAGDAVGVIMRNELGSGSGNDHAFDDIQVLDVTPQLDKEFADDGATLSPGDITDLVLTVTNTSELGVKTGWSFTDALPAGLKVAGVVTHDCAAATVAAPTGAGSIAVTAGSLAAGAASCSITVPVSAAGAGTYENSAHNITSVGLDAPGSTVVSYADDDDDLAAPDTGEQRASAWQPWAAIGAGFAVLVAMMTRFVAIRRRA